MTSPLQNAQNGIFGIGGMDQGTGGGWHHGPEYSSFPQMANPYTFTVERIENGYLIRHHGGKVTFAADLKEVGERVTALCVAERLEEKP